MKFINFRCTLFVFCVALTTFWWKWYVWFRVVCAIYKNPRTHIAHNINGKRHDENKRSNINSLKCVSASIRFSFYKFFITLSFFTLLSFTPKIEINLITAWDNVPGNEKRKIEAEKKSKFVDCVSLFFLCSSNDTWSRSSRQVNDEKKGKTTKKTILLYS